MEGTGSDEGSNAANACVEPPPLLLPHLLSLALASPYLARSFANCSSAAFDFAAFFFGGDSSRDATCTLAGTSGTTFTLRLRRGERDL